MVIHRNIHNSVVILELICKVPASEKGGGGTARVFQTELHQPDFFFSLSVDMRLLARWENGKLASTRTLDLYGNPIPTSKNRFSAYLNFGIGEESKSGCFTTKLTMETGIVDCKF